jgi:hypothetical protein
MTVGDSLAMTFKLSNMALLMRVYASLTIRRISSCSPSFVGVNMFSMAMEK